MPPVVVPAKKPQPVTVDVPVTQTVVVTVGGISAGYLIYRAVRLLSSLFPPQWETLPVNLAVP